MNSKRSFKKTLLSLLFPVLLSVANPAMPQEMPSQNSGEQTLEQKVSKPKTKIIFNYGHETQKNGIEYRNSMTNFYLENEFLDYWGEHDSFLYRDKNIPELTPEQETQIENILKDVENLNINSYQDFLNVSEDLSESQKLVLFNAIRNLLYRGSYDFSFPDNEVFSQETFFQSWQNYLNTHNQNPLGVCRHLGSHLEQLINELGLDAAAVSGFINLGHIYDIIKIENGTAILDDILFITNTKNIEKTLKAYQKFRGATALWHRFFNDNQLKYQFITKDGKHFFEFTGYDWTSDILKDFLIQRDNFDSSDLTFKLDLKNYLTSAEFNCFGPFVKIGNIRGDDSSPMKKMNLYQAGFKRNFSFKHSNFYSDISFIGGDLSQDRKLEDNNLIGLNGNVLFTTKMKWFNFCLRSSGNFLGIKPLNDSSGLFSDFILGAGASCSIPTEKLNIEPYIITQFNIFPKDLGTYKNTLKLNEITAGAIFDFKTNPSLSIDFKYLRRIWEQGFGGNIKIGNEIFMANLGGYMTRSGYKFCPHKWGFDIGLNLKLRNFLLGLGYELNGTNYDGEKENQHKFSINSGFNF